MNMKIEMEQSSVLSSGLIKNNFKIVGEIMRKNKIHSSTKDTCEITKDVNGYYTGCGMRVAFNKFFRFCPYCGKPIVKLFLMH